MKRLSYIAIHLANPTKINPSRSPCLSGKKAQLKANMSRGATIQLTTNENKRWYQISLPENNRSKAEGETRHKIGHIININAMAKGILVNIKIQANQSQINVRN